MNAPANLSYRAVLKSGLVERQARNRCYSLRAYARDLGLSPSQLSEILRGRNRLSPKNALKVARRLGLESFDAEYFGLMAQFEAEKDSIKKERLQNQMDRLREKTRTVCLNADSFRLIADWYHLPILEMTNLEEFILTPQSAAAQLGITALEAEMALERLERLERIQRNPDGRYQKRDAYIVYRSEDANMALRSFHQSMLKKASDALETQEPKHRIIGSETFAIDPTQLDEARELTEEYFSRMVSLFENGKHRTEVYHLDVALFSLLARKD